MVDFSISSLAAQTSAQESALAVTRGGRLLSATLLGGVSKWVEGEGPVVWGLMNADLSLAELEEYLELSGPLTPNDKIGQERASRGRFIKRLGVIGPGVASAQVSLINLSLGGLRFSETGETTGGWEYWAYNLGGALTAASQVLRILATHFVEWNKSG